MATETQTGLTGHLRGVTVTTLACLGGVAAAVTASLLVGTDVTAAKDVRSVFVLAAFIVVQFPLFRLVGIDVSDFGVKDYLYVAFMTFALWFVTFTILLTSGASL